MHPRKAIREAFRARFASPNAGAFLTSAADRVHKSRLAPIQDDEDLPAIIIYAREEKIDPESGFAPDGRNSHTTRTLDLVVSGIVRANDDVDDRLDDMAAEIEAAIDGWEVPGHETARIRLIETDIDLVVDGVKRPLGEIGLTYRITYRAPWQSDDLDDDAAWIESPDP